MAGRVDLADWLVLLAAAGAAGWVDAVVGGGGLIILPTLFLVSPGIAPATALGTNKFAAVAGTTASVVTFARKVPMNWRLLLPAGVIAAGAAAAGAAAGWLVDRGLVMPLVKVVGVAVGGVVTARPAV
ncbi:TSUP family transporter, partial [Nocardia farcinica]|uniref:TSUP family transporter n=1 Tax=Nocardia farcinica TaxID=37329 RepID=UPI003D79A745